MVPFGKHYIYHDGKVYKEVRQADPKNQRWRLLTKEGKRKWITKTQLDSLAKHRHL